MSDFLSTFDVTDFGRDGYLCPIDVLTAEEVTDYRACLQSALDSEDGMVQKMLRHKGHIAFGWLAELIRHPGILGPVQDLLGPDLLCWTVNLFRKPANDPSFVSWHQDATYWGLVPAEVLTAWVALSDTTPANGCMRIVPGSCAQQLHHVNRPDDHNLLTRGQTIERPVDEARAEDVLLTPGQMSLHHVMAVHGSGPNTTDEPRVGIAIRYLPSHVRQSSRLKDSATLVCGVDRYGHFEAEQRPKGDFDIKAFDYYQRIVERHLEILMTSGGA